MARQPITFEWQVIDDADWSTLPVVEQQSATPPQRAARAGLAERTSFWTLAVIWRSMILVCVGLFTATSVALSPGHSGYTHDSAEVLSTLYLEEQARQNEDEDLLDSLIDPQVNPAWRQEWRTPLPDTGTAPAEPGFIILSVATLTGAADDLAGDILVVHTLVTQVTYESWRSVPYREQRFYRQTGEGWMRTAPDLNYWGEQFALETPHLRFEFHERDAAAIMPMMARIEQLYLSLHALLELESPSTTNKVTFAIVPEPVRGQGSFATRHLFTSPMLDKVPADLTHADYLAHLIIGRLTNRAVDAVIGESTGYHATGYATYGYEWRNIRRAASGWLRTELLAQRSPWHQQAETLFSAGLEAQLPLRLTRDIARSTGDPFNSADYMHQYMLAESVIAYIAAAYGHGRLAAFVRSLGQHDSWNRLIPDVFKTSRDDFEAGWNHYLRTTYGSASHSTRGIISP